MLRKNARLRTADVLHVLARGKNVRGRFLSAKILSEDGTMQYAVVVSKSVEKSAVRRNRLRRSLYQAISTLAPKLPQGKIVFFIRRVPLAPAAPAFKTDIEAMF